MHAVFIHYLNRKFEINYNQVICGIDVAIGNELNKFKAFLDKNIKYGFNNFNNKTFDIIKSFIC